MTKTDQQAGDGNLSATSRRMLELRDTVLAVWEARVRASIDRARGLSHPILVDTLPALYDNIAQAISPEFLRAEANAGNSIAVEHGGERARITAYDHESLIREYQLFRWAIYDVLHREGVILSRAELLTLDASVDNAIQEAISGFVMVHTALRERFAAALTHDLRGPLGNVAGALELIAVLDDPAKVRAMARKALDNVHRMDGMIRDLLDTMVFHGGERLALTLTEYDIAEALRELQANAAGCGAGVIDVVAAGPVIGWWDRSAMGRAIENLVSNAMKYGSAGGPVTVAAQASHGRLRLTVHNEGNPIPPEEQESIFQMYRRSENARRGRAHGWGIGLPYVRAVVESHAGSVTLDSDPDRGTTFTIDTPLDCRPYDGPATAAPAPGN